MVTDGVVKEQRSLPRKKARAVVEIFYSKTGKNYLVSLVDIGQKGFCAISAQEFAIDSNVSLLPARLPFISGDVFIIGHVRWARKEKEIGFVFGVEFDSVPDSVSNEIENYLESSREYRWADPKKILIIRDQESSPIKMGLGIETRASTITKVKTPPLVLEKWPDLVIIDFRELNPTLMVRTILMEENNPHLSISVFYHGNNSRVIAELERLGVNVISKETANIVNFK